MALQTRLGALALLWLSCMGSAQAGSALLLDGGPSSRYLPGRYAYSEADATFQGSAYLQSGFITVWVGPAGQSHYRLQFRTPYGAGFAPGIYPKATRRALFSSAEQHRIAGIDVAGGPYGGGCNVTLGWFRLHEIEADATAQGTIRRLAIDFVQYCDGATGALFGALRLNSNVPVPSVAPYAVAGRDQAVDAGAGVTLDAGQSFYYLADGSDTGGALRYHWRQLSGPKVRLSGHKEQYPRFTAPKPGLLRDREVLEFELTVHGAAGDRATDTVAVTAYGQHAPRSRFRISGGANDWVSKGRTLEMDEDDNYFRNIRYAPYWVETVVDGFENWRFSFRDVLDGRLAPGVYVVPMGSFYPGISVSGNNAGCGQSWGRFEVLENTAASDTTPTPVDGVGLPLPRTERLAVDFEQYCDSPSETQDELLRGSVRVNSTIPLHDGLQPR